MARGSAGYSGDGSQPAGSRVGRLDGILKAQASEDEGLQEKMEQYAIRDEMTEMLFEYL